MSYQDEKILKCSEFEELLTDYLDGSLDRLTHKTVAVHALSCPLCHALLNEVKDALELCHEISPPKNSMTHLEARILKMTTPEAAMACEQFEEHLTDYLDGFLPAPIFHRWERHAVLCDECTDLPGAVVRSIAACYTYKMEELPIPDGLNAKILQATIGTEKSQSVRASWFDQTIERLRGLSFPISIPQLAPIALILAFAALFFSQTVSADGSIAGMYQKGFELAGQTYREGTSIMLGDGKQIEQKTSQEPISGIYVNHEESK
ncbi:MAG: zf-HC2 domain-containing protein [Acidobacteriota bacterium]